MRNNTKAIIARRRRERVHRNNGSKIAGLLASSLILIALATILAMVASLGSVVAVYAYYARQLPPPEAIEFRSQATFQTTKIYDRTGTVPLWEIFDPQWGNRTVVPLEQIPLHLRQATIAIEDKDFYQNPGIDVRGIARAAVGNLTGVVCQMEGAAPLCGALESALPEAIGTSLYYRGGGSSITQQLVKNVLIPPEERTQRTMARKIKEAILALEITRRYDKDRILEWYLNNTFYGNLAYGVEAAAEAYFGKHIQDLTLAESAMLAALPQAPGANSPLDYPEVAQERQHLVLDAMYREGYITYEEIVAAKSETLHYAPQRFDIIAPHFVMYVRQLLEERYGPEVVYSGGLRVYTTIDLAMMEKAQRIANEYVAGLQERNVSNAGLVTIKPSTGEILAMLGSLDYFNPDIDGQVNTTLASRQPGSSFKIFTYTTAFMQGYTPATMIMDVRTTFDDYPNPPYTPENYDRKYHGPLRIRQALARSVNIPAVKVLDMVGVKNVIATAHRMGINTLTKDYYGLSLTLGGGEVRLLDMTYAYGVLANGGVMAGQPVPPDKMRPGYRELDPVAILRVEDAQGNVLEEYLAPETREVLDPKVAYLMTSIFSDNAARTPAFGPNSPLVLSRPAAAKTGTTDDFRDAWTIGYTPQIVTGVWVGNSDNQPMEHVPGSLGAAPIWHDYMEEILASYPVEGFIEPPGLEHLVVDATSGLLPTEYSPSTVEEIFLPGTAPTAYDNVHQAFRIDPESSKLATVYCPSVEERVYEIYPPEAADWVRENEIPQPPTDYCDLHGPGPATGDVAITRPRPYAYVHEQMPIEGNARGPGFRLYRLEYGEGLNPSSWVRIGGDHHNQVDHGLLEMWDTSGLNGLYTLQLTVVRNDDSYQQASIQVTVDNIPPEVEITYPPDGALYVMKDDEWVSIQAEARDNFSIDRVEFYLDDNLLSYDTVSPYNQKWTITMGSAATETHTIHVVAIDGAGNRTESEKVKINIIPKKEEQLKESLWRDEERERFL
ncbi:MAG TPA: penicillin-binding protein [Chloroflexi bacterium]|nr:penicillin-binding protein [Chloroflexota bacterium]